MAARYSYDICLAGTGMGDYRNTTIKTLELLHRARIVFSLSTRTPWLRRHCSRLIDLWNEYYTGEEDVDVYKRLADRVLAEASRMGGVMLVGDGNPFFCDALSEDILRRGRRRGLIVKIEPAVSSLDVMLAQFGGRIGEDGLQVVEASALVEDQQHLNPLFDTFVLQVGFFGTVHLVPALTQDRRRLRPLLDHLLKFYPPEHRVRILRIPMVTGEKKSAFSCRLENLCDQGRAISVDATLHIPSV